MGLLGRIQSSADWHGPEVNMKLLSLNQALMLEFGKGIELSFFSLLFSFLHFLPIFSSSSSSRDVGS